MSSGLVVSSPAGRARQASRLDPECQVVALVLLCSSRALNTRSQAAKPLDLTHFFFQQAAGLPVSISHSSRKKGTPSEAELQAGAFFPAAAGKPHG